MITYTTGDATRPIPGPKGRVPIIAHCCNTLGRWGSGFVLALDKRWSEPRETYLAATRNGGTVSYAEVWEDDDPDKPLIVANIIGQDGVIGDDNPTPIKYNWISSGFTKIGDQFSPDLFDIHMPRIGCGLAGGSWDRIEPLIEKNLTSRGFLVTVYDLEGQQ